MNLAQKERRKYRQQLGNALKANLKRNGCPWIKPGVIKAAAFTRTQAAVKQYDAICKSVEADAAKAATHDKSCVCPHCTPAS